MLLVEVVELFPGRHRRETRKLLRDNAKVLELLGKGYLSYMRSF